MEKIYGTAVSKGIAIGKPYVGRFHTPAVITQYDIEEQHIEQEVERLRVAVNEASASLVQLRSSFLPSQKDVHEILESQHLMLNDPEFFKFIEGQIREYRYNVEWIVQEYIGSLMQKVSGIQDSYLSERSIDLYDVLCRLMSSFIGVEEYQLCEPVILVCYNLTPTELLSLPRQYLLGIALDGGGLTSHTAILAYSLGIPCVVRLSQAVRRCRSVPEVVLDGEQGLLILSPDKETRTSYNIHAGVLATEQEKAKQALIQNELSETRDGVSVSILANVRLPSDVDVAKSYRSEGIGLYCSEFLFLRKGLFSSEDEQCEAYSHALRSMAGKEVIIRTLDVGGDKLQHSIHEENPILGLRSLRFSFKHLEWFHIQLRALMRAAVHGNLSILFPLVSTVGEVDEIKQRLKHVQQELEAEGIEHTASFPIGVMIEVPAAVMLATELAGMVDFLSIGTNDLVQYTMAVDRGNEYVSYLYSEFDPAVVRMLKYTIDAANAAKCPITLCGEMAHDLRATAMLLGMGLRRFSVNPHTIYSLKQNIAALEIDSCRKLVDKILPLCRREEIIECLQQFQEEYEQ